MPISRIKGNTISINVDGKIIDIKNPKRGGWDLNKALLDPKNFKDFANDPQAFTGKYGFKVDADISAKLKDALKGVDSLEQLRGLVGTRDPSIVGATVWAVAAGSYSMASSKIAVAF